MLNIPCNTVPLSQLEGTDRHEPLDGRLDHTETVQGVVEAQHNDRPHGVSDERARVHAGKGKKFLLCTEPSCLMTVGKLP